MSTTKIIAQRTLTTLDDKGRLFKVTAKFQHLKGNARPYFSCTAEGAGFAGCIHEDILKFAPEFAQAVAIHLSDDDGTPMHAIDNGWYWFGGTKYQLRDNKILADHLRITVEQAAALEFNTREEFSDYIDTQRSRWQAEAMALKAWLDGSDTVTPEAQAEIDRRKVLARKVIGEVKRGEY